MILSTEDGHLFYRLWLPLLDYVNKKYRVSKKQWPMTGAKSLDPADTKQIADRLWDDVSVIDDYLAEHGDALSEEHKEIIRSWKRRVRGKFIMERHLNKGSIFISMENQEVYQVSGIVSSWGEMFRYAPMPLILEATFIPFKNVIISDGLIASHNITIGENIAKLLSKTYKEAKRNGKIHNKL